MIFDIRTPKKARCFIEDFLKINSATLNEEYSLNCRCDFDEFWSRWKDHIDKIDINDIEFRAFHVTTNNDNCSEIRTNGIKNLQLVLSEDTKLKRFLEERGIRFNIENKQLYADKISVEPFDIDYNKYKSGTYDSYSQNGYLKIISRKIYSDFQVNGFFFHNNARKYVGIENGICRLPEFLYNVSNLYPKLYTEWTNSDEGNKGYVVSFKAKFNQIDWSSTYNLKSYREDQDINKLQLKEWLLKIALYRGFNGYTDETSNLTISMKPETIIKPDQILDYKEIHEDLGNDFLSLFDD